MRIDIMLPYYGDSEHLRLAVRSVIGQTHANWRLVCVDDGHPGPTAADWLTEFNDSRIQHVSNPVNLGVAANFQRCLSLVEAEYFVMMGSDDLMHPEYLANAVSAIQSPDKHQIYQFGVEVIDESGELSLPMADRVKRWLRPRAGEAGRVLSGEPLARNLALGNWLYFPSLVWETKAARAHGFRVEYPIALDLALVFDVLLDGGTLYLSDDVTFSYRRHRASASMAAARSGERFSAERKFFTSYGALFQAHGWPRAARAARRHLTSRLNALVELPGAARESGLTGTGLCLRHALRF